MFIKTDKKLERLDSKTDRNKDMIYSYNQVP